MDRRQFLVSGLATGLAAGLTSGLTLAAGPARAGGAMFCSTGGVAIGGYDSVSYFAGEGPRKGRRDIGLMWKGAVWYFATAAHRDMFESNPWALAPRYGAYCAFAMSQGRLAKGDPRSWMLAGGRLYLTVDPQALVAWEADMDRNVTLANGNWPGILRRQGS